MRLLLAMLLCLGCAKAATTGEGADSGSGGGGRDGTVTADAHAADLAPAADGATTTAETGEPAEPGFIPPSLRDGGIPKRPPGAPPCAPDSNAGQGNTCPYKDVVECTPPNVRPVQTCICLAPPLGGKWSCEVARDGGLGS